MALTKISRGLLSTGVSDSSDATAITIDSNEKVGLNGLSAGDYWSTSNQLVFGNTASAANGGMTIATATNAVGQIYFADGTSGDARYRGQIQYTHTDDAMDFATAASFAMRIDSSGNVGIGLSNPSAYGKLVVSGTATQLALNASSGKNRIGFFEAGTGRFYIDTLNGDDGLAFVDADGSTERMRINSSGNVGIADTAPAYRLELPNTGDTTGQVRASGFITYSDGRLKTNRSELDYGLNVVKQLQPLKYFHKASTKDENGAYVPLEEGNQDIGFIAQDVLSLIPEIVGVPENDETDLYSLDYTKLTPVLVKAIQELSAKVEELESKIDG